MSRDPRRELDCEAELARVSSQLEDVDRDFRALNEMYNILADTHTTLAWKYDLLLDKVRHKYGGFNGSEWER